MPEAAIPVMLQSTSEATVKQYHKPLRLWWSYCQWNQISYYDPATENVLEFLSYLLETVKTYGTLNNYKSAISLIAQREVGEDPRMRRFFKGLIRVKPQTAKYESVWDPEKVLEYLKKDGTTEKWTLEWVTMKLATLLALVTGQRVQTISLIRFSNIKILESGIRIRMTDHLKTTNVRHKQPNLVLPYLRDRPKICVASLLREYEKRTSNIRDNKDKLLITHKAATAQSITRWIKHMLKSSGIDTDIFSPHNTRHAATSAAQQKGLSIEATHKAAGWSDKSRVFAQFYNRTLPEEANLSKG